MCLDVLPHWPNGLFEVSKHDINFNICSLLSFRYRLSAYRRKCLTWRACQFQQATCDTRSACSANNSSLKLAFARHLSDSWSYKEASWSQARCESLGRSKVKTNWKSSIGYIGCPQHLAPLAPGPEQATLHCISQVSLSLCCLFYRWQILCWPLIPKSGCVVTWSTFREATGMHALHFWGATGCTDGSIKILDTVQSLQFLLAFQFWQFHWPYKFPVSGFTVILCFSKAKMRVCAASTEGAVGWMRVTEEAPPQVYDGYDTLIASRSIFGIAIQKVPSKLKG